MRQKKVAALKNEHLAQGRSVNVVSEFRVSARETCVDGRGGSRCSPRWFGFCAARRVQSCAGAAGAPGPAGGRSCQAGSPRASRVKPWGRLERQT